MNDISKYFFRPGSCKMDEKYIPAASCLKGDPNDNNACEFVLVNLNKVSDDFNTASEQANTDLELAFSKTDKNHLSVASFLKDNGYVELENFDVTNNR